MNDDPPFLVKVIVGILAASLLVPLLLGVLAVSAWMTHEIWSMLMDSL